MSGKIIVRTMNVGMCNQLFTYAYARYMAEKYQLELYLDYSHISEADMKHHADYANALGNFSLKHQGILLTREEYAHVAGRTGKRFDAMLEPWYIRRRNRIPRLLALERYHNETLSRKGYILNLLVERECPGPEELTADTNILYGYWQSPEYARALEQTLRQEIVEGGILADYPEAVEKLSRPESVCVHIRRGDYIGDSMHDVCTEKYYREAMELYRRKLSNPRFYFFSDDRAYADKIFCHNSKDAEVCDAADNDCAELVLMSLSRHRILSNSSFSWWAQMLSGSKDVIAPSRWYGAADKKSRLYEDFWQIIQI